MIDFGSFIGYNFEYSTIKGIIQSISYKKDINIIIFELISVSLSQSNPYIDIFLPILYIKNDIYKSKVKGLSYIDHEMNYNKFNYNSFYINIKFSFGKNDLTCKTFTHKEWEVMDLLLL